MSDLEAWANGPQQPQSPPEMSAAVPQSQSYSPQPQTVIQPPARSQPQYAQSVAYTYPQSQAYPPQPYRQPVDIEKVKLWIQFGSLMLAFLFIGWMAGSLYTRATLVVEQSYGTVQQR